MKKICTLAALAMFAFAVPAMAVDQYWGLIGANSTWNTVGNWVDSGGSSTGTVPVDGDNIRFISTWGTNSAIDINGATTNLPTSNIYPQNNNTPNLCVYDSATMTPNAAPPANNTDFTLDGARGGSRRWRAAHQHHAIHLPDRQCRRGRRADR